MFERGWFGAPNQKLSPMGSVLMGQGRRQWVRVVGLCNAGCGRVRRLGWAGGQCVRVGAVWCRKPETEPYGLGFSGTCRRLLENGGRGVLGVGKGQGTP